MVSYHLVIDSEPLRFVPFKLSQSLMEALTGFGFFSVLGSVVRNLRLVHRVCCSGSGIWRDDVKSLTFNSDTKSGTMGLSPWKAGLVIPAFHTVSGSYQPVPSTNSFIVFPYCSFKIQHYEPNANISVVAQPTQWNITFDSNVPSCSIFIFNWDWDPSTTG